MFELALGPSCQMWNIFAYIMRGFHWVWGGKRKDHELKTPLASFPEFEFKPTSLYSQHVGQDVSFVVVNTLDLLLQEQGLMADALVVEAIKSSGVTRAIWFRYNVQDLHDNGTSLCTLLADDTGIVFEGVCGTLSDRKRK